MRNLSGEDPVTINGARNHHYPQSKRLGE
jgi:hypothetical protein